jgi:hypothetical protein
MKKLSVRIEVTKHALLREEILKHIKLNKYIFELDNNSENLNVTITTYCCSIYIVQLYYKPLLARDQIGSFLLLAPSRDVSLKLSLKNET